MQVANLWFLLYEATGTPEEPPPPDVVTLTLTVQIDIEPVLALGPPTAMHLGS
jgi:hypothetical protein